MSLLSTPPPKCSHCAGFKIKHDNLCPAHFKKLQERWYQKIADKGFHDVEQDETHLKIWDSTFFQLRYGVTRFKAQELYYQMASQFLNDHRFKSRLERMIWLHHSDGLGIRKIAAVFKRRGTRADRNKIHKILRVLVDLMLKTGKGDSSDE